MGGAVFMEVGVGEGVKGNGVVLGKVVRVGYGLGWWGMKRGAHGWD
ncbi:uncharacterized protein G2W53_032368 [Senna tora]|uniref:Uncharacterized protein n=1 Tax=Senna tora TaxID=362788 RepID=A0A834SY71_9FABA|nr:uncharacterized protein G2W53_032368 [Senna tora]